MPSTMSLIISLIFEHFMVEFILYHMIIILIGFTGWICYTTMVSMTDETRTREYEVQRRMYDAERRAKQAEFRETLANQSASLANKHADEARTRSYEADRRMYAAESRARLAEFRETQAHQRVMFIEKINLGIRMNHTTLFLQCEIGGLELVELFLDKGSNIHQKNNLYETPLILAAKNGRKNVVNLLLDRGANISDKDHNGKTALMIAIERGNHEIAAILKKWKLTMFIVIAKELIFEHILDCDTFFDLDEFMGN
jgi:hypothetical protein